MEVCACVSVSIVINATINLLLYHIQTVRPDADYHLSSSARELPILQFADDTCLIANLQECHEMICCNLMNVIV